MKKGLLSAEKIVIFLIVIAVLLILATLVFKIQGFKELFSNLLETFK